MARYVILEFDDNAEAEAFHQAVSRSLETERNHVLYTTPHPKLEGEYSVIGFRNGVRVKGLFAKPTNFCECPPSDKSVLGRKLGWHVCLVCRRAKRGWQYPFDLLQAPGPMEGSLIDFTRRQMMRPGFIEGLDKNPQQDYVPPKGHNPFAGKRGKRF